MNINEILCDYTGWSLKIKTEPTSQIELSKKFTNYTNIFIVIAGNDGYTYKHYTPESYRSTEKFDIHISLNGPLQLTMAEFNEIKTVIDNAKKFLSVL